MTHNQVTSESGIRGYDTQPDAWFGAFSARSQKSEIRRYDAQPDAWFEAYCAFSTEWDTLLRYTTKCKV